MKTKQINYKKRFHTLLILIMVTLSATAYGQQQKVTWNGKNVVVTSGGRSYSFRPQFTILYTDKNPALSGRYSGVLAPASGYHVPTWNSFVGKASDQRDEQANQNKREGWI